MNLSLMIKTLMLKMIMNMWMMIKMLKMIMKPSSWPWQDSTLPNADHCLLPNFLDHLKSVTTNKHINWTRLHGLPTDRFRCCLSWRIWMLNMIEMKGEEEDEGGEGEIQADPWVSCCRIRIAPVILIVMICTPTSTVVFFIAKEHSGTVDCDSTSLTRPDSVEVVERYLVEIGRVWHCCRPKGDRPTRPEGPAGLLKVHITRHRRRLKRQMAFQIWAGCQYPPRGELKFVLNTGLPNTFADSKWPFQWPDLQGHPREAPIQIINIPSEKFSAEIVPGKIISRLRVLGNVSSRDSAKCLVVI